jgi:hypothetical protein
MKIKSEKRIIQKIAKEKIRYSQFILSSDSKEQFPFPIEVIPVPSTSEYVAHD